MFIGTMIDITESKRAQDKLRATQTELARVTSLTAAGQMAASMAHEIKQPLAAIVTGGSAGLRWLSKPTPDLEEVRALLESIVIEGNRASQVIDGIRAMFKNDSREKALLDVNEVIREVIALLHSELQESPNSGPGGADFGTSAGIGGSGPTAAGGRQSGCECD
jgi:C4-dicarboxylate-specific signal transduction histidine kinase